MSWNTEKKVHFGKWIFFFALQLIAAPWRKKNYSWFVDWPCFIVWKQNRQHLTIYNFPPNFFASQWLFWKPLPPNFGFLVSRQTPNRQFCFEKKNPFCSTKYKYTYLTKKIEKAIHNIFNLRRRKKIWYPPAPQQPPYYYSYTPSPWWANV